MKLSFNILFCSTLFFLESSTLFAKPFDNFAEPVYIQVIDDDLAPGYSVTVNFTITPSITNLSSIYSNDKNYLTPSFTVYPHNPMTPKWDFAMNNHDGLPLIGTVTVDASATFTTPPPISIPGITFSETATLTKAGFFPLPLGNLSLHRNENNTAGCTLSLDSPPPGNLTSEIVVHCTTLSG